MRQKEAADSKLRRTETSRPFKFDPFKSGVFHEPDFVPDRDGASYSLRPGFGTPCKFCRELRLEHDIGKPDTPSRLEHAE
jgi:hypothetical protein